MTDQKNVNVTREYYNSLANDISENYPQGYQVALIKNPKFPDLPLVEQHYRYLLDLIPDLKLETYMIDFGCGNGQFFDFLQSSEYYKHLHYIGIDSSEKQIEIAGQKKEGSFIHADFEKYTTLSAEFNYCFFLESIGYTTDLDLIVKVVNFILYEGGYVVIKNPIKIVNDEEKDKQYSENMKAIEHEYGFSDDSLGMIVDKKVLEETFLKNGFELCKFETPEIDVETYNKTFSTVKQFSKKHPKYIKHIKGKKRVEYNSSKNKYYECGVFVFKKVEEVVEDFSQLPHINPNYTAGMEQASIDPTHPDAPYRMSRTNQISYGVDMKQTSEDSNTVSINSSEVAETSKENPMNIRLDITYEDE